MSLIALAALVMGMFATAYSQDVCVGVLTVSAPDPLATGGSGTCTAQADVTYALPLTGLSCTATTCTVDFYYTDNVDYLASGIVKSATGTAAVIAAANPLPVTACGAAVAADGTVTLALDAACTSYTHLCAVVTCTGSTVTANDFSCITLNAGTAGSDGCSGSTSVPDVSAGSLVILTPPLTSTLCDAEVKDATFTLVLTGLTCTAATCTEVEFYYSASDAAPGGSAEKYDATSGDVTVPVCSDTPTTFSVAGKMVTLDEEADDCSDYTHLCAIVTCTSETTITDNFVCVTLDGSTPSTAAGTTMEAATENAATTTTPGYLVLPLVMYAVMSH